MHVDKLVEIPLTGRRFLARVSCLCVILHGLVVLDFVLVIIWHINVNKCSLLFRWKNVMLLPSQANQIPDDQFLAKQNMGALFNDIKDQVSSLSYKTWFQPILPIRLNEKDFNSTGSKPVFLCWLEEHYNTLIRSTIVSVLGESGKLFYFVASEEPMSTQQAEPVFDPVPSITDTSRTPFAPHVSFRIENLQSIRNNLNPRYLFRQLY